MTPVRTHADVPESPWRRALAYVTELAVGPPLPPGLAVTVHFHPDRLVSGAHLATDRVGQSQTETGDDRWRWEQRAFGGAYDEAMASQRPKYGSLNYRAQQAGGSVRCGSSHFRLADHVVRRTTFCYPDNVTEPAAFGTAERFSLIAQADDLDKHIEAHVHGVLRLNRDVEALVLDPSYRGTAVETAAAALPFPTEWHHGFRLSVDRLAEHSADDVVETGARIAEDCWLDARIIGDAVRAGVHDATTLNRVWHCTARYGHPWPGRG